MSSTLSSAIKRSQPPNIMAIDSHIVQLGGDRKSSPRDPRKVSHFKSEFHRILLDYQVCANCFTVPVQQTFQRFADLFEDTREQIGSYIAIYEKYKKLTNEDELHDPSEIRLKHGWQTEKYVTTLRDGDTWESVHSEMRDALLNRHELTFDFFSEIINFLI